MNFNEYSKSRWNKPILFPRFLEHPVHVFKRQMKTCYFTNPAAQRKFNAFYISSSPYHIESLLHRNTLPGHFRCEPTFRKMGSVVQKSLNLDSESVKSRTTENLKHRTKSLEKLVRWFTWTMAHDFLKSSSLAQLNHGSQDAETSFNGVRELWFMRQTFPGKWSMGSMVSETDISGLLVPMNHGSVDGHL